MNKEAGISLAGLLVWGFIVALVALLGIKVAPSAIEFHNIRKDITAVAQAAEPEATAADLRRAFARYAEVDGITDVQPADLDIVREGNRVLISVAYEKRIALFGPVSLLIDYQASSSDR